MDRVVKLKTKANISPCAQYLHTVFFLIHVHTGPMIIRSLIYTGQGLFYTTISLEPLGNIAVLRPTIDKKGTCKLINHTYNKTKRELMIKGNVDQPLSCLLETCFGLQRD